MTDDELVVSLTDREVSEAARLGVSPEAMLGSKTVEVARSAERLGMSVPEYVAWSAQVDAALAARGAVNLADWQSSREARGKASGR